MQPIILPGRPQCEMTLAFDGPALHKPGWSCDTWLGDDERYYAQAVRGSYPNVLTEWYWLKTGG